MGEETRIPETPTLLLDRYRIDGMLGEGGLGTVYKAYDTRLKRTVAIKTLKRSVYANDPDMFRSMEERFRREAEAGSRMHVHPNLVVVHDFVTDADKSLYLIQEFVPDGTLAARLAKDGALPPTDALRLAADVARGLSAAHEMHIVHRDIKPANIFLSADGRARVGDFGIAQLDELSNRTRATEGHPGTPLYMSPEQAGSSGYVRAESDQYSLGLVLFEMLTGQTYKRIRKRQAEELLSQQPQPIQTLVRRMISDDPDDRYESTTDVATEIGWVERQLASATTLPPSLSDKSVGTEPMLTESNGQPQMPQTEHETRRQTPRVNLQPVAAAGARLRPPPAIPMHKSSGRRNVIVASSVLALVVGSAVVLGMMRSTVAPSATATFVAAIPTLTSNPIATPTSVVAALPVVASTPTTSSVPATQSVPILPTSPPLPASAPASASTDTPVVIVEPTGVAATAVETKLFVVNTDGTGVNLRDKPDDTTGRILTNVPEGTQVVATGAAINSDHPASSSYYPVRVGIWTGFIRADYLGTSPTNAAAASKPSVPQSPIMLNDPFEYCARVGKANIQDRKNGPVQFSGFEDYDHPFPAAQDKSYTIAWRCSGGKVLGCHDPIMGFRAEATVCGQIDLSRTPSQSIIDECHSHANGSVSDYGLSNSAFEWTCRNGVPIIMGQSILPSDLDEQDFQKKNWYVISR